VCKIHGSGRRTRATKAPANETSAQQPSVVAASHRDCSSAQESTAASAASQARSLAGRAQQAAGKVASAGDDPASTATGHYQRWFGRLDGDRAQIVRDTFAAIASSLGGTLHLRCDPEKNVYAYVNSCGSKEIYLGRLFWSRAGNMGIDSRPGVILHEMAHDVSRFVGDHSYGVAGAEDLAAENPDKAVRSADNYEYYAESL
jgi:peptidyl-Lys metalloendopeptidase